jgi:hypothetical protein
MTAERHLKTAPEPQEPNLVVMNTDTGEQLQLEDYLQGLRDEVSGLQRSLGAEHRRYEQLKRDKLAEAKEAEIWPAGLRVFEHWRKRCKNGSKRTTFTLDRFEMIAPFLEQYGDRKAPPEQRLEEAEALCKLAVEGIAFDHYETPGKNGKMVHHIGWHLIFGEADLFEKRCNAAPVEMIRKVLGGERFDRKKSTAAPAAVPSLLDGVDNCATGQ